MAAESTLVLLFVAATAVALLARRLRVPYTVGLVVAGLGLGAAGVRLGVHLSKELLYALFLPGLIFEAAYHLDLEDLKKTAIAVFALAVPGVMVAIGATAWILTASSRAVGFPELGWAPALVFAALIAATDPIAVVALFKSLGAPRRLAVLVDAESLVNDGTAIVLFTIVYSAVSSGVPFDPLAGVVQFGKVVGLGLLVGAAVSFTLAQILKRVDEPMVEITLTVVAAYGSFALAERLHASGVIATVTAGVVCGGWAVPLALKPATRIALESFWEYVAFALNSIVFLLLGAEVRTPELVHAFVPITLAFVAVTFGRAVVVGLVSAVLRPTRARLPLSWSVLLTWGGLRGALSMVLALAIPLDFPGRHLVVTMTFGVVLLSILVQGMTAGPLLRLLGLAGKAEAAPHA